MSATPAQRLRLRPRLAGTLAGCVLATAPALADGTDVRDLAGLSLEDLLEVKVDTVSAASKRRQLTTDAPASVTVVNRDQIEQLGHQTLADILRGVRGLYVTHDRNYSYLGSRGFSRNGDYNSRVLFLVNGQRINDGVTDGALIGQEFVIDVDMIERVEVVRGPGSALYGSSAYFGVVNIVTREPASFEHAELSVEGGSLDFYKATATLGHRWDNEVEFTLSGSIFTRAGWDELSYPELASVSFDGVARGLDHEDAQRAFGRLAWKGLSLEFGYVDRFKRVPTASFGTIPGDNRLTTADRLAYGRLMLEHTFESGTEFMASVAFNHNDYDGQYPFADGLLKFPGTPYIQDDSYCAAWVGEEVLLRHEFWDRLTLTGGVEGRQNVVQEQLALSRNPYEVQLDDRYSSEVWSAYTQADWKIAEPLTLSAGGRFDHFTDVGSAWNPRIAGIWQAAPSTTFKAIYGTAFRAPNAYELRYSDGGVSQKTNPDLGTESIRTYELVLEQQLGKPVRLTISGYRFEADDLIRLDRDPADSLLVFRNIDQAVGHGLEAQVDARFGHGWRAQLSHALQRVEDHRTGMRLDNSPQHIVQGQLIIPLWSDRLTTGIEGRYVSGRRAAAGTFADPQFVMNITLFAYRWAEGLEFSASVYNVFDRRFSDPAGAEHRQRLIEQDGRLFRLKLTYAF